MKKENFVKSLESISRYERFSKYGFSLDKKFKTRSLVSLVKSLKKHTRQKHSNFLDEFTKRYPYENGGFVERGVEEDEPPIVHQTEPNKCSETIQVQRLNEDRLRFLFSNPSDKDYPDPFKYSPNYKCIYKNSPYARITVPCKDLLIKKHKQKCALLGEVSLNNIKNNSSRSQSKLKIRNREKENNNNNNSHNKSKEKEELNIILNQSNSQKSIDKIMGISSRNNNNENESVKPSKSLPLITNNNFNKKTIVPFDKHNHALRFSKYLERKNSLFEPKKVFQTFDSKVNDNENYCSINKPERHNRALDFSKMKSRDGSSIINVNILGNPSFFKYSPSYNLIVEKPRNITFSPEKERENNAKKGLIQKIWRSYDPVFPPYLSIDNNKLNERLFRVRKRK